MKKFRTILALMLTLALIFSFAGCGSKDSEDSEPAPSEQSQQADSNESSQPEQSQAPESSEAVPSGSQTQENQNNDSSTPDQNTAPSGSSEESNKGSQAPVAEVPEELTGDFTGEFVSDTGTALNLIVKWAASYVSDDSLDVTFQFYLSTYSLQVSDRSGNKLEIKTPSGVETYSFTTKEINKKDNKLESIYLGQTIAQLSKEEFTSGVDVKATWDFRGSYSDKALPEIVAEGKIKNS